MQQNAEEVKPVGEIKNEEIKKEEIPIIRRRDLYKKAIYIYSILILIDSFLPLNYLFLKIYKKQII